MHTKIITRIWMFGAVALIIIKLLSTLGFSNYLKHTVLLSHASAIVIAPTAPLDATCGYHAKPCCPQISVGSHCQDGSTCMPNAYCVFPAGSLISPTQTTTAQPSPTTPYQMQTITPVLTNTIVPNNPTPTSRPFPTNQVQAVCGKTGDVCCDPIKLILDPLQSQAITSQSGYCYSPSKCTGGMCLVTTPTSAPTSAVSTTSNSTSLITQLSNDSFPPIIQLIARTSHANGIKKNPSFSLTTDVVLPECPLDLRTLPTSLNSCFIQL